LIKYKKIKKFAIFLVYKDQVLAIFPASFLRALLTPNNALGPTLGSFSVIKKICVLIISHRSENPLSTKYGARIETVPSLHCISGLKRASEPWVSTPHTHMAISQMLKGFSKNSLERLQEPDLYTQEKSQNF
jgi:hypothetical protein